MKLTPTQREFLTLVTRAASCNPFSDEFAELQLKIAGCPASTSQEQQFKLMTERWNEQLHKLQAAGVTGFKPAEGEDREILRYACLYEIYHRYLGAFDDLIVEQIEAGERSVPVPFAGKALTLFARRGFTPEEARRHFAIMYQVRRAFRFIDRGLVGRSECMK